MKQIYDLLLKEYGPQGWWPINNKYFVKQLNDKDRLEIILGAILTQNTAWTNVEKALNNLREKDLIDIDNIIKTKITELIRPAGYFNQKAERLKIIAKFLKQNSFEKLKKLETKELREILLDIKGVGPETADSILLYAFEKPSFVVDAYTKRIFSRLEYCYKDVKYDDLQEMFMKLDHSVSLFNEYHALIVEHAKQHCKNKPVCEGCV